MKNSEHQSEYYWHNISEHIIGFQRTSSKAHTAILTKYNFYYKTIHCIFKITPSFHGKIHYKNITGKNKLIKNAHYAASMAGKKFDTETCQKHFKTQRVSQKHWNSNIMVECHHHKKSIRRYLLIILKCIAQCYRVHCSPLVGGWPGSVWNQPFIPDLRNIEACRLPLLIVQCSGAIHLCGQKIVKANK